MPKKAMSNAGAVVAIVVLLAFFYVYQKVQIIRIGYKVRSVEKQTSVLQNENSMLHLKISTLISPEHIASEIKRLGIDLVPPKEKQIVRIK